MTEKGIVSGDDTGKFNPNDNITREQFLKMLVEAAGIETDEAENTFADVKDAWYKPYVLKAKNFGIVNGISDTEFGIGSNITRQDMAVMITRTIENNIATFRMWVDGEEVTFDVLSSKYNTMTCKYTGAYVLWIGGEYASGSITNLVIQSNQNK